MEANLMIPTRRWVLLAPLVVSAETTSGARSTQRRVGIMRLASMRSGEHVLIEHYISFSRPRKDRYFWFWPQADLAVTCRDVCFRGQGGHGDGIAPLQLLT